MKIFPASQPVKKKRMTALTFMIAALMLLFMGSNAHAGYLDPRSFSSLGIFNPGGNITVNMSTGQMSGGGMTFTGVVSGGILVFNFDSFTLPAGINVTFTNIADNGNKIAFLSKGDITIGGNILANASSFLPGSGGHKGGEIKPEIGSGAGGGKLNAAGNTLDQDGAGGGGFGGAGGAHGYGALGGPANGDLAIALAGGSGGAKSKYSSGTTDTGEILGGGGGGGGALELGALGTLTLNSGANIEAKGAAGFNALGTGDDGDGGGSGGGILIHAKTIIHNTGATINAAGGKGGDGGSTAGGGGGGGGGGRIYVAYHPTGSSLQNGATTVTPGSGGADPGGSPLYPGMAGSAGVVNWVADSNVPITSTGPEIVVEGNGAPINDGDNTPDLSDYTDFGDVDKDFGTKTYEFFIKNVGTDTLTLTNGPDYVTVNNAAFTITSQPSSGSIGPGASLSFSITFDPGSLGEVTAELSIANNDANENPYNFTLKGCGTILYLDANAFTSLGLFNPGSDVLVDMSSGVMNGGMSTSGVTVNNTLVFTFDTFTLASGTYIYFSGVTDNGYKIAFLSKGDMTIGGEILANASSFLPGPGGHKGGEIKPEIGSGAGGGKLNAAGNTLDQDGAGGGGFGGAGGAHGYGALGGSTNGDLAIALSGGSGGARSYYSGTGGFGGGGGGALELGALGTLTLNSGANIEAKGAAGFNALGTGEDGDGGGSGGGILMHAKTITHNSGATISATGGKGGDGGSGTGGAGGGGGGGRIRLAYHPDGAAGVVQDGDVVVGYGAGGVDLGADIAPDVLHHGVNGSNGVFAWVSDIHVPIAGPEMDLDQNGLAIADGGTFDFGDQILGGDRDVTFTIQNSGAMDLSVTTPITITGADADQFSVEQQPGTTVAPGASTDFIIRFTPTTAGAKTANIVIANNDANENPYNLILTGTGVATPEMQVLGNGVEIVSGVSTPSTSDHTDFGSVDPSGVTIVRTFTIRNLGTGPLNLGAVSLSGTTAFSVTALPTTPVDVSDETTLQISFKPDGAGLFSATVSIANDDSDENPYDFAISGTGSDGSGDGGGGGGGGGCFITAISSGRHSTTGLFVFCLLMAGVVVAGRKRMKAEG